MSSVGIFCGSANGNDPVYSKTASQVGQRLAEQGVGIVYGGGKVGLMGAVADAALQYGGAVIGVIPQSLVAREIAHTGLTHLHVVANMHERKMKMAELADAFIALPGGAGTLEEIFEQWTWAQLGLHAKPCAFFDVNGFYRPLQDMIRQMVSKGFLKKSYEDMLLFSENLSEITEYFADYRAPDVKWVEIREKNMADEKVIHIAAAVITDPLGRVLLVRKRNTAFFMQPGDKIEAGERRQRRWYVNCMRSFRCRLWSRTPLFSGNSPISPPTNPATG